MSEDGSETHQQQPVSSVKWTPGKIAERERSTLPPKKKSSKSRSERNNRRLRAFLAKKSESTAEIGNPALFLDTDFSKPDELDITTQPIETDSATDTQAELDSKKDEAPPPPTATSSPKSPASSVGADGKSTTGRERKERRKHKKGEIKIQKNHTRPSTKDLLTRSGRRNNDTKSQL
ncbi:unnamed protein product [Mytilus coruscus]|uniref:Uncharacterized protein n=1 Tax=Mytilus coruscus TaxID=42192 RepID=A0A6J8F0R9_MYTCO|nr:unnamed protein product [Mytilus coruscus]